MIKQAHLVINDKIKQMLRVSGRYSETSFAGKFIKKVKNIHRLGTRKLDDILLIVTWPVCGSVGGHLRDTVSVPSALGPHLGLPRRLSSPALCSERYWLSLKHSTIKGRTDKIICRGRIHMHCLILVPREEAEKEEVSADESVPVGDQTTLQPKVTYLPVSGGGGWGQREKMIFF